MNKPYIYKLVLVKNTEHFKKGSVYIGQTNGARKSYWAGGTIPRLIAKKYGRGIFKKKIIKIGDFNRCLLDELEKHYIRLYASNLKGLNIKGGGREDVVTFPVFEYDLDGNFLKQHKSVREVSDLYKCSYSGVYGVCVGKNHSIHKRRFRFYKVDKISAYVLRTSKPVYKYSIYGDFIEEYESLVLIRNTYGRSWTSAIARACVTEGCSKGFLWSYEKKDKIKPYKRSKTKEIYQYDLNGNFIKGFISIPDAVKCMGMSVSTGSALRASIDKERSIIGFQWRTYKVDNCGKFNKPLRKSVVCLDMRGNVVEEYESIIDAANSSGINSYVITRCCKGMKDNINGFKWVFK